MKTRDLQRMSEAVLLSRKAKLIEPDLLAKGEHHLAIFQKESKLINSIKSSLQQANFKEVFQGITEFWFVISLIDSTLILFIFLIFSNASRPIL